MLDSKVLWYYIVDELSSTTYLLKTKPGNFTVIIYVLYYTTLRTKILN